jgi:hypothetical protein
LQTRKEKEAPLLKLFGESQSLLHERMLFEKRGFSVMEARGRGEKAA